MMTRGKPPLPAGNRTTIPLSSSSLSNPYTDKSNVLNEKAFRGKLQQTILCLLSGRSKQQQQPQQQPCIKGNE
jgi:hypothetical protein